MKNFNYIEHGDDPTRPVDQSLSTVSSVEAMYNSMTPEERLMFFASRKGYTFIPPSVERLYSDTYYLGGEDFFSEGRVIFDFWKDALQNEIFFPGDTQPLFTRKPFLILSGAIGIGKSTISKICLALTYARLLAMRNPSRTLGLAPKPLSCVIFHRSEETAVKEFKNWFKDVLEYSPFFKNTKNNALNFRLITSGPRGSGGLGSDVIFYILGEVNFWDNQTNAQLRVSESLIRFKSRFSTDALQLCGQFIIDSSARGSQSVTEWFLDNTEPKYTWNCHPAHYEVRKSMYQESQGKTFRVFTGNQKYPPRILYSDEKYDQDFGIDKDKVIEVPIQLLGEYKSNVLKAIQDFSGISAGGDSESFFGGNIEHLINCSKIPNKIPEIIEVDFYNKQERLIDKIRPMLGQLPSHTPLWVGLDLSAAQGGDMTGISAVSFDGWKDIGGTRLPLVKCWFTVAIRNKSGQEISLFHIYQLLQDLNKLYSIIVAADQAFSRQILQDCTRDNIKNVGTISTDRVPCEPAIYLKNLINNELISLPEHKRLQREAYDLHYDAKGKVDHPKKASISAEFDNPDGGQKGSKDVWDSLAQACYCLKLSIDEGEEYGTNSGYTRTMQATERLVKDAREESQKSFQGMLEGIFTS